MSTAVLISGQMRTFAQCLPNLHWMVFRHLKDPVFFVSCADDEQATSAYMLEGYYKNVFIEKVTQPTLPEPSFSLCRHAPYTPTPNNQKVVQSILRQLWAYNRVWEFMKEKSNQSFTTFVRCRPDLHFHGPVRLLEPLPDTFFGPWKATCGGVNDRFSMMGQKAAESYFTAITKLKGLLESGCPLHPETIQHEVMSQAGISIHNTLMAEFTCLRLPGTGDHVPLVEYPNEMARFLQATA